MPPAEAPPLFHYPAETRRPFGHDDAVRRMAKVAQFGSGVRLLNLGCGSGAVALLLAKEFGCHVTAADADPHLVEALKERSRTNNLADRVQAKWVDLRSLSFPEGEFAGIVVEAGVPLTLEVLAQSVRRFLAPKGRLVLVYPVKVGRKQPSTVLEFWSKRVAESLRLPREVLEVLETAGFEPQSVETLPDVELDDMYRSAEGQLAALGEGARRDLLKEEIALYRTNNGKSGVSFAQVIARRKEPGEKPPPSRSQG